MHNKCIRRPNDMQSILCDIESRISLLWVIVERVIDLKRLFSYSVSLARTLRANRCMRLDNLLEIKVGGCFYLKAVCVGDEDSSINLHRERARACQNMFCIYWLTFCLLYLADIWQKSRASNYHKWITQFIIVIGRRGGGGVLFDDGINVISQFG